MLKQIFGKPRELLRSPFTRNVGSMMMFTAVGQSVYLLSGPLIGRIFSPSEFGLYGLFYTFAITAVGVIFLNFDFAVPAAATDEEARDLTLGAAAIAASSCGRPRARATATGSWSTPSCTTANGTGR